MKSAGLSSVRLFVAVAAACVALAAAAPASAQDRYAAIVMDARSGEVLLEEQADAQRYPASLTKMMTLYMVFEALERGNDARHPAFAGFAGDAGVNYTMFVT